jgi:hypothetical protein
MHQAAGKKEKDGGKKETERKEKKGGEAAMCVRKR